MRAAKKLLLYSWFSCLAACGSTEDEVLRKFFAAVNAEDRPTLAGISRVDLTKKVARWELIEVLENSVEPFRVGERRRERRDLAISRDRRYTAYNRFRAENYEALKQIQSRTLEEPDYVFQGPLGEIQREWNAYRREQQELGARLDDLDHNIDIESILARMSLMTQRDVERLSGEVRSEDVLVRIEYANGGTRDEVITLKKYELWHEEGGAPLLSRWIIAAMKPRGE